MANEKNISLDNLKTFKKKADATYAKKTDITTSCIYVGKASEKSNSATTNGNTYLKLFENDTKRSQHLINGGGATMVSSDASGTITVSTPIKNLDTTSGSGLGNGRSENIAGSGTIYLHKVAKTGKLTDLSDRTFSNILSRGEEYLEWGGPSQMGGLSPLGVALSEAHSINQVAFINEKALTFEYSSDGGVNWTPYPSSIGNKSVFCTMTNGISLPIGRPNSNTDIIANKSKTRVTITALDGQNSYLFAKIKKMLIYVSTASAISLLVETRTGTNYNKNGAWDTVGTYSLGGWSGWNDIPLQITLGGYVGQTTNNYQLRLTASCPEISSLSSKEGKLLSLKLFGDTCWIPANSFGTEGKIYAFDINKNVTFPSFVSASSFFEGGTAISDKYLAKGYLERLSRKLFRHTIKIEGYSERTTGTALVCMLQVDSSFDRKVNSFEGLATVLGSINKETGEPGIQSSCMVSGGIVVGSGKIDYILPLIRLETDGTVNHTVFVNLINEYPDLSEDVDSHFGSLSDYSTVTYTDSVTPVP